MALDNALLDALPEALLPPDRSQLSGLGRILVRENVLPWSDLDAQNIPDVYLSTEPLLLPTLSVLVGQAQDRPRLLQADSLGRLIAAGPANIVTTLAVSPAGGSNVLQVSDSVGFAPGDTVIVVNPNGFWDQRSYQVASRGTDQNTLQLVNGVSVAASYAAGAAVVRLGSVSVLPALNYKTLYGTDSFSAPAVGTKASITIGVALGQTLYVTDASFKMVSQGAVVSLNGYGVIDNQGNTYWSNNMGVQGINGAESLHVLPERWVKVPGAAGRNAVIGFTGAPAASVFQSVDCKTVLVT